MKEQLEKLVQSAHKGGITYSELVRELKRRFLVTVLEANKGNSCRSAIEVGMHRNTLSRTLHELNINPNLHRPHAPKPVHRVDVIAHTVSKRA